MFTDPLKNIKMLGLRENNIVADLGAGTGFYSIAAGHIVSHGKVYAVEVQQDFLHTIKNKAKDAHLNNVEVIWGNVEKIGGTKIADGVVDAAIASNILFQTEEKDKFLEETKRILKPGGRVLLIDWSEGSMMKGAVVVPKDKARAMFEAKGFKFEREIPAGAHHYGMILIKG